MTRTRSFARCVVRVALALQAPIGALLPVRGAQGVIGVLVVSLLVVTLGATAVATAPSQSVPLVDPEVRTRADAGRVRVLLELRVDEPPGSPARAQAIARAQDAVLSRVSAPHALLVRRYTSVPMLALEIDATGLRALAEMTDIVVAVKPDRTVRTQ